MPKSTYSYISATESDDGSEGSSGGQIHDRHSSSRAKTAPQSPTLRTRRSYFSSNDLSIKTPRRRMTDELSCLLGQSDGNHSMYHSVSATPRPLQHRQEAHKVQGSYRAARNHSRRESWSFKLVNALDEQQRSGLENSLVASKTSGYYDERVWYDQFTSTDWVHDSIADAYRVKTLRSRKDFRGRLLAWFDGAQGWILVAMTGCLTAVIAYFVNVTETVLFDYKYGFCSRHWYYSKKQCCFGASDCEDWTLWSKLIDPDSNGGDVFEFLTFNVAVISFALTACLLTLLTKTVIPSAISLSTLDENLGADIRHSVGNEEDSKQTHAQYLEEQQRRAPMVYYSAAGSGVAEIKVLVSGFVLHGYLGLRTLVIKTLGLVLSVASGMSLGKEGPYVHIATCVGNICCRTFSKYTHNDGKRREVLSAASAAGVAVAFGAPIGGVLFSLEEVSYYFPPKVLFRTFFCCIAAALSLKFLNPYGTGKIVLFEVRYLTDWKLFEIVAFVLIGVVGGAMGALFIKASRKWAKSFRSMNFIRRYPLFEVFLVALVTGLMSYWNRFTKLPVTELLFELSSPCDAFTDTGYGLCPTKERIPTIIWYLGICFVIKAFLTIITFGIKVPAGIYVPSMVVGGIMGRMIGHSIQYLALSYPQNVVFGSCDPTKSPEDCVVPGVYAMVAAGATMCGVTRLSLTLAVILFELTGSLDHVLPFSLAVLAAKWTADALEPLSIYDLLLDMNSYPFLDNKIRPIFTTTIGDIIHGRVQNARVIDISSSPLVPATQLREKLNALQMSGELDGGLPIVRDGVLKGLIPAPDLAFALDKLDGVEEHCLCLMSPSVVWAHGLDFITNDEGVVDGEARDRTDFTPYIDPSPLTLDVHSPMDLVYECFVKLGLRYICVSRNGHYAGLLHKKKFVKYTKEVEAGLHG